MDSAGEQSKKVNLEDLPKDELVKRCKNLLAIAQKAKTAKDAAIEEVAALKKQQAQTEVATQDLVESMAQQKLTLVTTAEELRVQVGQLGKKLEDLETKNEGLVRQNCRLTEENEQLITDLEVLEKQGLQQQAQLLELEKAGKPGEDVGKISELQGMLSISLEEVKKLHADNKKLLDNVEELRIQLAEKEGNCLTVSQELQTKCDIIEALNGELDKLKLGNSEDVNGRLKEKLRFYHGKLVKFAGQIKTLKTDKAEVLRLFKLYTDQVVEWRERLSEVAKRMPQLEADFAGQTKQLELLEEEKQELMNELDTLKQDKNAHITNVLELEKLRALVDQFQVEKANLDELLTEKSAHIKKLEEEVEHSKSNEQQFAELSSEEIVKLVEENKELGVVNAKLQEELDVFLSIKQQALTADTQTDGDFMPTNEMEEQIVLLKRENGELLREMNEMNQALKERGETISNLESHCEEIMKKLQVYETQANKNVDNITQKDEMIKKLSKEVEELQKGDLVAALKTEIDGLKERINGNLDASYAESETMSTSTISRSDESNRLKELEGSWEERYGKLRNLAVKLKAKIRELTNTLNKEQLEKDELQRKLAQNIKTIQTLQEQCDKLEDQLEASKKQANQYMARLNSIAEDISKDKQQLVNNDDVITKLRQELEASKSDKLQTENWKKQVSAKIQTLRKELEANNVLKKEFEAKIGKLTSDLEAKEQQLKAELDNHRHTKAQLDQSNNEVKKNSVLSLEMQDYERSVKELAQKIDKKQEQITKLKSQVDSQKTTINALREQNKLLEEKLQDEETTLTSASSEMNSYKKKINELEGLVQQKEEKIRGVTDLFETARSENEELSTELSKVIAEHQKAVNHLKSEKDHLRSQMLGLQQTLRATQDSLSLKEDELRSVSGEYEGYKVRAQSVLRQNQSRDVGLEEKLTEEVTSLKSRNDALNNELKELGEKTKNLEKSLEKVAAEKEDLLRKYQESESDMEDLKNQFAQLSSKHQKTINEHAETVRSLKVHADTLSQCYRQQLSDQEVRHNREIIELQSKLEKAPTPNESFPPLPPTMAREEGEGSESIESTTLPNIQQPVPLERLLGNDLDHELPKMKKHMSDLESKVVYLTALLSDTEQDLAKHVQMNKMLKEEIRRQQRSVEREKHAENLEYLKNVVFKFVTLNSGDERSRLVPVLNTILKLSPEETNKLGQVARGDPGLRGWTNYLPTWSSPGKPQ